MRLLANKVSKIAFVSLTAGALLLSGALTGVGGTQEVWANDGVEFNPDGSSSRAFATYGIWDSETDEEGDNTANARVVWQLREDIGTVTDLLPNSNLIGDDIDRFFTLCAIQPGLTAPNAYSGGYSNPEVVDEWVGTYRQDDGTLVPGAHLSGDTLNALAYLNSVILHESLAPGFEDNEAIAEIWAVQNWVGAGAPPDNPVSPGITLERLNEIWDNAKDQAGPYTVDFDLTKDESDPAFDYYIISDFEIRTASGSLYSPIGGVATQITVSIDGEDVFIEEGELTVFWDGVNSGVIEFTDEPGSEITVTATTANQLPDHELLVIHPTDNGDEDFFRDDVEVLEAQSLFVLGSLVSTFATKDGNPTALEPGQITTRVQRSSITLGDSVVDVVTKQNFPASELGRNVTHSLYKVSDNTNYVPTSESECVAPVATQTTAVTNGVVNTSWTPTETGTYVIVSTYNGTTSELNVRTSCLDPNERFSVLDGDVADTVAIEISSDIEDNVVSQTERVIDNIHVALADETVDGNPSVWPTNTSGENLPVSINIHTYGPFDNVQGAVEEVPEGLEPVHTTTLTVTDEGTFPVEVAREAAGDRVDSGFYTVVAEYLPSAQVAGVAEYIVNPVITNFFDPRETFSVTTTPGISTKVNKTVYAKGERVVDSIFQVGFSDNQGDFEGTEDFLADNTTVTHRLYFVGDGEVNDTVCIAENEVDSATGLAGNREYSVQFNPEKEGKYTIQSTFTGDDRNAPVVTECGDPDETFIVTELEVTGITGIWLVVSSVLIALGLGGLLYGNRRESEVAAIA